MDSILTSVKKLLGLPADYEAFDPDIIIYKHCTQTAVRRLTSTFYTIASMISDKIDQKLIAGYFRFSHCPI